MEREILSRSPGYVIDNSRHLLWCDKCDTTNTAVVHIDMKVKTKNTFTHDIDKLGLMNRKRESIDKEIQWLCGQCFTEVFPKVNHSTLKNFKEMGERK